MQTPLYKDLVLIGGGHSHALVLKMWAMKPLPGVRLTLISPQVQTPYSGMLPGLVSGHYTFDETHIDLARLCQFAGARFIQDAVTGMDLANRQVLFAERTALGFDVLSINAGITPDLSIPGARDYAIPVKPIARFYPRWQHLQSSLQQLGQKGHAHNEQHIAVVGGGAAGVELILAMEHTLSQQPQVREHLHFHLVQKDRGLPENYPSAIQKKMAQRFKARKIEVHENCPINAVEKNGLLSEAGDRVPVDHLFWCTNARASQWPQDSELATDEQGFIALNQHLQSLSHECVFAAGDIAQQQDYPRPRAGVFAVRQGPALFENLRRYLLQQPLKPFRPQKTFLSLLAAGDKYAFGSRIRGSRTGGSRIGSRLPSIAGQWVWRWKDRIDRKFMAMFNESTSEQSNRAEAMANAPVKPVAPAISGDTGADNATHAMRCGGCGAKVGATVLSRVINQLQPVCRDDVVLGLQSPDDASAIQVPEGKVLLQSVDSFRALLDDPYVLGQIAANHALSDLFAMNAQPHSALALATLPYAGESMVERDLLQLMSGALQVLNQHNCALIGGHTSEGAELSIGFSVNGLASEEELLKKGNAQPGHLLILTQALGTGTLFAAHNQGKAKGRWIEGAIAAMLQSNRRAGELFYHYQASACTDVTGFGLLGHLVEMLKPANASAQLQLDALPALEGAVDCFQQNISSSLQPQNSRLERVLGDQPRWASHPRYPLLFDPQTSGGLLASVPAENCEECLQALRDAGYSQACVIGTVYSRPDVSSYEVNPVDINSTCTIGDEVVTLH